MSLLEGIVDAVTNSWLWAVVAFLGGGFSWLLNEALGKELNRQQLDRLLDGRRYAVLYHELLHGALARADRWLTPGIGPSDEAREAEGRRAWSWPLFDLSLRLALIYPLLTLLIAWGILGLDGKLGNLIVLPAAGWGVQVSALTGLGTAFWLFYRSRRAQRTGNPTQARAYLRFGLAAAVVTAVAAGVVTTAAIDVAETAIEAADAAVAAAEAAAKSTEAALAAAEAAVETADLAAASETAATARSALDSATAAAAVARAAVANSAAASAAELAAVANAVAADAASTTAFATTAAAATVAAAFFAFALASAAFAVVGAAAVVFAVGLVGVFTGDFAGNLNEVVPLVFAVAAGTIVTFVTTFAVAFAVDATAQRTRFALAAYALVVLLLLLALAIPASNLRGSGRGAATFIVFLGLLPLLNAVFDFLSIGLTRWLLKLGAASPGSGALSWAIFDLLSALGFFALLGLALVTMVHWLNGLGAAPLLDLVELFVDIRADPGAYWWLYVTIFSTLLPTLLHLILASFSALLAIMPESVALFIRRQLPRIETDAVAKALAFWTLSTIGFLAIAAVAFGLYGLVIGVLAAFPYAGDWYLYAFERYAAWLGAPVVPVRPEWF